MTADQFTIDLNYEHWFWLNPAIPALTAWVFNGKVVQVSAHYAAKVYFLSFGGYSEWDDLDTKNEIYARQFDYPIDNELAHRE